MVPVLSKSKTSISPATSTALPDFAITLAFKARFIPAIPIAGSKPPMVVGIKHTNKATNRIGLMEIFRKCPMIGKLTTTMTKVTVMTVNKIPSAISFGVF